MVGKTVNKSVDRALFEITPEIQHFAGLCEKNNAIDKELYTKYEVKRGRQSLLQGLQHQRSGWRFLERRSFWIRRDCLSAFIW